MAETSAMVIKRCSSFNGYSASNDGRVFSHFEKSGIGGKYRINYAIARELKTQMDRGYQKVTIKVAEKPRPIGIHVIIADAFLGVRKDGMQIRHLNGVETDNRPQNLAYGSAKENGEDRARLGESARGSKNGATDFTAEQVIEIRRRHAVGENCAQIARSLNKPRSTIHAIVARISWKYL